MSFRQDQVKEIAFSTDYEWGTGDTSTATLTLIDADRIVGDGTERLTGEAETVDMLGGGQVQTQQNGNRIYAVAKHADNESAITELRGYVKDGTRIWVQETYLEDSRDPEMFGGPEGATINVVDADAPLQHILFTVSCRNVAADPLTEDVTTTA
jgi:hypothetical protein